MTSFFFLFGQLRTVTIDNEPWFVGKRVVTALGYERADNAIRNHVEEDEIPIQDSIGRMQKTPIINESGLYALIFGSKLESAKRFKHWVTFKDIDTVHKRPDGTARRNFNQNRQRFISGVDFFKVCADEIRTHKIAEISPKSHEPLTLITETGYLMLVKSSTDDFLTSDHE